MDRRATRIHPIAWLVVGLAAMVWSIPVCSLAQVEWSMPVLVGNPPTGGSYYLSQALWLPRGEILVGVELFYLSSPTPVHSYPALLRVQPRSRSGELILPDSLAATKESFGVRVVHMVDGYWLVWTYPAGTLPDGFERYELVIGRLGDGSVTDVRVIADSLKKAIGASSAQGVSYVVGNQNYYGVPDRKRAVLFRLTAGGVERHRLPTGQWLSPSVFCADSLTVQVSGWSGYSVCYAYTTDGGKTWNQPAIPGGRGLAQASAPAMLPSGKQVIVWMEDRTGDVWPDALVASWTKPDGTWHHPVVLNAPLSGQSVWPSDIHLAVASVKQRRERLYAVWAEGGEWTGHRTYLSWFDGSTWSPKLAVLPEYGEFGGAYVLADSRGTLHVLGTLALTDTTLGVYYFHSLSPVKVKQTTQPSAATRLAIRAAYPNPFNATAWIEYSLPSTAAVRLTVLGLSGTAVRTLYSGSQEAGLHRLAWDGRDESGRPLPSGVYIVRLQAGGQVATRKVVLVR